jgi:hypothetical protein
MPSLHSIHFDHSDWQPVEKKPYIEVWADDIKQLTTVLSLEYFDKPPEIAVPLSDINKIRFLYRSLANQSGAGLISAEVNKIADCDCIETIFKMPQSTRGMVYIGSLTLPFAEFSYVIKIQGIELGFAGVREAVVMENVLAKKAELDAEGKPKHWERDPYDEANEYPFMPNMSEAEIYDDQFPMHALSKVRRGLKKVLATLHFEPEVLEAERFS